MPDEGKVLAADGTCAPCSGLTVVDMSGIVAGPLGARILADLGATVIKVETPTSDHSIRGYPPLHHGHSAYFEQLNFGKKSLAVDIKTPEGLKIVKALCATADVFFQNSRPGVMERLGLGYEELRKSNPGLVYVSISGFGDVGEGREAVAYDHAVQGMVGFMPVQGSAENPQAVFSPIVDKITAIWAANAAVGALLFRERSGGVGQHVSVNMVSAYASFILPEEMANETFRSAQYPVVQPPKQPYQCLETADGRVIGLILTPVQYGKFCRAIGRDDLADDPTYRTSAGLVHNMTAFYAEIAADVRALTTADFLDLARQCSIPFSSVKTTRQFMDSTLAKDTGAYQEMSDPDLGIIRHLGHPVRYSVSPAVTGKRAPRLGEHNAELLALAANDRD